MLSAVVTVALLALCSTLMTGIVMYRQAKVTKPIEKTRDLLVTISETMTANFNVANQLSKQTLAVFEELNESLASLSINVQSLEKKTSGAVNEADSARLIKVWFDRDVVPALLESFVKSLKENNYEERKKYVADKVRTNFSSVLGKCKDELSLFLLSIPLERVFETYTTQEHGNRYVLCDILWNKLESLFLSETDLEGRKDEAGLIIRNTLRDYLLPRLRAS